MKTHLKILTASGLIFGSALYSSSVFAETPTNVAPAPIANTAEPTLDKSLPELTPVADAPKPFRGKQTPTS